MGLGLPKMPRGVSAAGPVTTPMGPDRFVDRFRHYRDMPQQRAAVLQLYEAIRASDRGAELLDEQAAWAVAFSQQPPASASSAASLDPRGSEEAGMAGPAMAAPVKPGDSYLLVNDRDGDMEAYDHAGVFLWRIPCLARGQGSDHEWTTARTDTPPGLYRLGELYADYEKNPRPACSDTAMAYGWFSFDMVELEDQEVRYGRAGIMIHGGGSACGWPGAWADRQPLHPTHGCVRVHNVDLRDRILPLYRQGTVYVGVFQEK